MKHLHRFRRTHFGLLLRILPICLLVLLKLCNTTLAQSAKPQKIESPDVLVLVMCGMSPYEQVSINYATAVSNDQALKDLAELRRVSGIAMSSPRITTESTGTPGAKPTTSVAFSSQGFADYRNGTFNLEPLIIAFKRYKILQFQFMDGGRMVFRGLKDFDNEFVKISMRQSGTTYGYRVKIKNSKFERIGLPLTQPIIKKQHNAPSPMTGRVMVVLGIAILAAVLVYFITARLTASRT